MSNVLVIVESPTKAKTIGRYLGDDYDIMASVGHIRDLPSATMGVDIKQNFKPRYITMKGKEKVVKEIKAAAQDKQIVLIATDPDREGEAIAWHLANLLKIDPASNCRITFNEITEKTVQKAVHEPRSIDMNLVDAQQARRVLDRLVGYEISPLLWKKVRKGLSAGRVQSVAMRMIVEREAAIQSFVPEEYWQVFANLMSQDQMPFKAKYHGIIDEKNLIKAVKITHEAQAMEIVHASKMNDFVVHSVKKGQKKRNPYPPFTTSLLQQEASKRLNFTSKKTMRIAQELYEGVQLPGVGPTALVTYIRTDSTRVSTEAIKQARSYIERVYGLDYLPKKPIVFKNKNAAQDAHEAIRPSHFNQTPEKIKDCLSYDQYRLYKLIWDRFIASQMEAAKMNTLSVNIAAGEHIYRVTGQRIVFPGFLKIYGDHDVESDDQVLPDFKEQDHLKLKDIQAEQKFTQPPARYTEASLIKAMEEEGIGRPSTYAPTLSTILERHYVEKDQKQLVPTDLGTIVTQMLTEHFNPYINVRFTAQLEHDLDAVEAGDTSWTTVLSAFYPGFHEMVQKANESIEKIEFQQELTGESCPECGAPLVYRDGRYGRFIACTKFPDCTYKKGIEYETNATCPICTSPVVAKKSKRGKIFYVCTKTHKPDCTFISWNLPLNEVCPVCDAHMEEVTRGRRTYKKCSNQTCASHQKNKDSQSKKTSKSVKASQSSGHP